MLLYGHYVPSTGVVEWSEHGRDHSAVARELLYARIGGVPVVVVGEHAPASSRSGFDLTGRTIHRYKVAVLKPEDVVVIVDQPAELLLLRKMGLPLSVTVLRGPSIAVGTVFHKILVGHIKPNIGAFAVAVLELEYTHHRPPSGQMLELDPLSLGAHLQGYRIQPL